jgi:magnesium chelatase accessory protein
MSARLLWDRDGLRSPHREASRFVDAGGLHWHLRQFAALPAPSSSQPPAHLPSSASSSAAPLALLLHGTGASSHSWLPMVQWLRPHFDLLLIDLPGHAYTSMASPWQASLPGMAHSVYALLRELALEPSIVIAHSAGAALAARMCLDKHLALQALVSINGAFLPLGGLAGVLFPPAAKLMAALPFAPGWVAQRSADRRAIDRLVSSTGSSLDVAGTAAYAQLVSNPGHVAGALAMMANWDVRPLLRDLPRLQVPLTLITADRDLAVAPAQAQQVRALLRSSPQSTVVAMHGVGHIAHEEQPAAVAALCVDAARAVGLVPPTLPAS